jgi:ribosome-associated translation inhibitor RaiA
MHLKVRGQNLKIGRELRKSIQRRLWFVLGRFGRRIMQVNCDLAQQDDTGHKSLARCRIVVRMVRSGSLCIEESGTDVAAIVERATDRVGWLVRREVQRQRELSGQAAERDVGAGST